MRLKIVVGYAPILNGHVRWQKRLTIALGEVRLQHEIAWQKAPHLAIPMNAAAADTVRRHKSSPTPDRKRSLAHPVAKCERELIWPQKQLVTDAIAELVLH